MLKEIKKINKFSFANILGIVYAFIGLFFGVFFYLYFLIKTLLRNDIIITSWLDFLGNFIYVLISGLLVSLFSGIMAWLFGLLIASLYNLFARRVGGIKLEIENQDYKSKLFKNY